MIQLHIKRLLNQHFCIITIKEVLGYAQDNTIQQVVTLIAAETASLV